MLKTRLGPWVKARFGSARDRCSAQNSFFGSRLDGSTWLEARLSFVRGQAQLETRSLQLGARVTSTRLGNQIDASFGSALTHSGSVQLSRLTRAQLGDRLQTGDSGFGLVWLGAQLGSFGWELSSAHLG